MAKYGTEEPLTTQSPRGNLEQGVVGCEHSEETAALQIERQLA